MVQLQNLYWIVFPFIVRIAPTSTSEEKRPGTTVTLVLPMTWEKRPESLILILAQRFLPLLTLPKARFWRYSKDSEETKNKKNTPPKHTSRKDAYFNKKQINFISLFSFQIPELKAALRKAGQTPRFPPSPCSSRAEVIKIDRGKPSFNRQSLKYLWHRLPSHGLQTACWQSATFAQPYRRRKLKEVEFLTHCLMRLEIPGIITETVFI